MIPEFFPHDRPSPGEFSKDCRGWACRVETVFCRRGISMQWWAFSQKLLQGMSAHSLCSLSCRKIHIQNKRWNISASQPYRPPAQNRARPGRAGGLFLSVRAGAAGHNCFASNARKPVDERASNRALKQIGFKLLLPVFNGVSRWPLAHPENRRLLSSLPR